MDEDLVAWVDQEMLDTIFVFVIKEGLDHDFTEVGSSLDYGCSLQKKKKGCVVSMKDMSLCFMDACFLW